MRSSRLLVVFIALLTFSNSKLNSQTQFFAPVFSKDSLKGFDEAAAQQSALSEGFYGKSFAEAMIAYKRQFVINKYDLYKAYRKSLESPNNSFLGKYSVNSVANAPCVNEGFESGTLTGWTAFSGLNNNSQAYPTTPTPISLGTEISIVTTPLVDPFIGAIPNSPLGGTNVVKINNSNADFSVVKLSQTFNVASTNYLFDFAYWAVMQDAGAPPNSAHTCSQTPFMLIKIRDNNNILQGCPTFSIVAPSSGAGGCAGIGPLTWVTVGSGSNIYKTSNGWQKFSIDLTPYLTNPTSNITVEVFVGDCNLGGHWGYAYFDSRCNTMDLTVNNQTLSMPSPTVYPQVQCGGTATMTAPAGLINYLWNGPPTSGISNNTNSTVVSSVPGNYTLTMTPPGICNPISKIVNLQFVPPTTVTASPANLCATGTNTSSTLSASGAAQYTWMPGGSNSSSITVTPAVTTVYTLTARTGTCLGTYTVQVTVNPDPVFNVISSNGSICPGQSATMTAISSSSNSYNWNPGSLTGSMVVVTQTIATTYTTIATSTAGCTSSVTTTIGALASPTVGILNLTAGPNPTFVCSGSPVSFVATGATILWQPGNISGPFASFNPTVTTTYTAFGSAGTCTSSATITMSVDPGPSMTITANPTITCPGNTTTLSVVASSAVGSFTWNPGPITGPSIVVTPTIAGGYSVSARNVKGCVNTRTVNPNISPSPSIVINPATPSVCLGSSVTLSASGGTAYTWMPGSLTGANVNVAPLVNTTYTVTGTNGAGCNGTNTVMVTVVSLPTVSATVSPATICAGSCATITPSGASTYTIQGGLSVVCPTSTTTYSIIGRSAAGCNSSPITVTVNVNPSPTIVASASPTNICAGASATLNATGGVSYTWSTGSNSSSVVVTPSITTTFTLIGANAFNCTRQTTVTVVVSPTPTVLITPSAPTVCPGASVTLNANGATSFTWLPINTTGNSAIVAPLVNTTYTAIGSNGTCVGQRTVLVSMAPVPVITASYSPATICAGSCATLNTTGGVTYTVTGLTNVACPLVNTGYTVVGSNAFGCRSNTVVGTLSVTSGPTLITTASPTAICPGDSSLMNATGALSYTWQPGNRLVSSFYAKPLITTTYTVTGVNALGCISTRTITLIVNPTPSVNASASPTTVCIGSSSTLTATGATSYSWMPGSLTGSQVIVSPVVTTVYTLTGSSGGCSATRTVAVNVNPIPTITVTATPTTICAGRSATLTATGSSATYSWSTGQTVASIIVTPVNTTTFNVFGISASGCRTGTLSVTVSVTPSPTIGLTANPSSICVGGSSTLTPTGGLSYTLLPGAGFVVSPIVTTVYTVTGVNASGCTSTAVATVFVNSAVNLTTTATPSNVCAGSPAVLSASGATSYTWQPGSLPGSNVIVTPTSSTVYTVTGSTGGCIGSRTVAVNVTPAPTISITATPTAVCAGSCATLTASGGSNYAWSNGTTGPVIVVCPSVTTSYTVIGTLNGCTGIAFQTIFVNSPTPFFVAVNQPSICSGGSSTLTAGVSTNTYTWLPGPLSGSQVIVSPVATTVYTVTGTNAQGCTSVNSAVVVVNPPVTPFAVASTTNICTGGMVNLQGGGATTYTWLSPSGPPLNGQNVNVFPTATTVYTLQGASAGCSGQSTIEIAVTPSINVSIASTATSICAGNCVTLTATGAASYTWSSVPVVTGSVLVVCPTSSSSFSVFGSASNCFANAFINISVNSAPVVNISSSANPICSGSTATLTAQGATNYTWSTGSNQPTIAISPNSSTVITVTGSTGPACNSTVSFTQNVVPTPTLIVTASSPSVCNGFTTALLALGAPSVTWTPGGSTSNPLIVSPLSTTIYTATGANGACTVQATTNVVVLPLPIISVTANPGSVCLGNTTTLTASGANSYTWVPSLTGGPTFVDAPTVSTTYTVVGFGTGGCPNFTTITVNVVPAPVITITSPSGSVCLGSVMTLTATGATNYTWIPSMTTGNLFTVSPGVPTTYSVIGDNGGCSNVATISLGTFPPANILASASNLSVCPGNSVTLTAAGGITYTWIPQNVNTATIVEFPGVSTQYSVTGTDANGCIDSANVFVSVTPMNVTAVASPSDICEGGTVTLSGSGGLTYTWMPGGQTNAVITVTPSSSTIYTLLANDASGCTGSFTVPVNVFPTPSLSVSPLNSSICAGSSITLTATGATNYTWLPTNSNSSVTVESPLVNTTYTVIGDNGGICVSTFTFDVFVNPLPTHVGASSTGTVSCTNQTINLFGSSSSTNVSYGWNGPQGYNSAVQNPTVTGVWGTFTLTVTDNVTGCTATATVDVPTDNSIPLVTAVASGSITCSVNTVTLNAIHTTTNPSYSWTGPGSFTSAVQNPTANVLGTYTVTLTDLSSTCSSSAIVTIGVHTLVEVMAMISPATCSNGVNNNDGYIALSNFTIGDKYDLSPGITYTGNATYATAAPIPATGTIVSNLANPSTTLAFTVRIFDGEGCQKDTTLYLIPTDCNLRTLGIAKSASQPILNGDGSYNVTYTVVVKNYDQLAALTNVTLTENLSATFPSPATFTVYSDSTRLSASSSLSLEPGFDGSTQTNLLQTGSNALAPGQTDTIQFTVKVRVNKFFVAFSNSIYGEALNTDAKIIADSSHTGLNPDPDADNNPYNNNSSTPVIFNPKVFFGITKTGAIQKMDNDSYDISYTVTVHNLGNDTIRDITLIDTLLGKTIKQPATYTMRSAPVSSGIGLLANSSFDGRTDFNLVIPSSKMPPGISSVHFVINVVADTITWIKNSAYGNAYYASGPTQNDVTSDTSNAGTNPDVNNNGIWNEASDNVPTLLLIPNTHTLFIPEGFSPDGDNINDNFVIAGLSTTGNNEITIFNRWGNKVYHNGNYDNTWNGLPNVSGTLGKDRLPPGTYYYILDMKGSGIKPISGFIVIQY